MCARDIVWHSSGTTAGVRAVWPQSQAMHSLRVARAIPIENACDRALPRVISLASVRMRPLGHRAWDPSSMIHPSRTCARRRTSARIPTSLDEVSPVSNRWASWTVASPGSRSDTHLRCPTIVTASPCRHTDHVAFRSLPGAA